jgi:competence protein ComEC
VLLCLPVFLPQASRPGEGAVQFSLLDVGQGLSAVVQTARHTLVFDTGPRFSPTFDTGEAVIVPFLRQHHIQAVDTLLISHSDMDHIGGAQSVLRVFPVGQIISSVPSVLRDQRDTACLAGQQWQWDGVDFRILYPSPEEINPASSDNNLSCVLQVTTPSHQILLTGDIEAPAEAKLISRYGKQLQSSILVLPHHGSKTSSSPAFLDSVNPDLVVIPAGWHNRFGLPAKVVVGRLRARQLSVLNTATAGTIQIELGKALAVRVYREQYQRYWQVW